MTWPEMYSQAFLNNPLLLKNTYLVNHTRLTAIKIIVKSAIALRFERKTMFM